MHLLLTCLYNYCIGVQIYAEMIRNDYHHDGTCLLASAAFPLTISYDHPVLLRADLRGVSFKYTARCYNIPIFVF